MRSAIWTETYDRRLDDGFEVQDEIIQEIISALDVKLLRGEQAAVWHKTLKNRDALEYFYCSAPGSLDTSLSHAAGLIEIAACHA